MLDGSLVVGLAEVNSTIHFLAEPNRIVAEGAGAASVAAALTDKACSGKMVCIISERKHRQIEIGAYISRQGPIVIQGDKYKIDKTIQAESQIDETQN